MDFQSFQFQPLVNALAEQLAQAYGDTSAAQVNPCLDAPWAIRPPLIPPASDIPAIAPIPDQGLGETALPQLWQQIIQHSTNLSAPGMMGHMDTAPHPVAALTDAVVSALNNNLLFRELSPIASRVEEALVADIGTRLGLSPGTPGTFTSGGSIANLTALFAACGGFESVDQRDRIRLHVPACIHTSIKKAAAVLGITPSQVMKLDGDAEGRHCPELLEQSLKNCCDRDPKTQNIVVIVLGTTIHGGLEDVDELTAIAKRYGAWVHVDAIYGGALAFSHHHRQHLKGLDQVDSVVIGPQKWWYVPRLCAMVFLRDPETFNRRLALDLPYSISDEQHRGTWGLQGSRRADAVTLWVTLQVLGADAIASTVDQTIAHTQTFHQLLLNHPYFEPTHVPELNIQCFHAPALVDQPAKIRQIHQRFTQQSGPWLSLSQWKQDLLFRMVLLSPATESLHLQQALTKLQACCEA